MKKTERTVFAPLIRVSTEDQADRGRSLVNQRENIIRAIKDLGGDPGRDVCKWFAGQEHATRDQERAIFDELLEYAKSERFSAVMVDGFSRWSRDTYRHEDAFRIFRQNGILFYDLNRKFDPQDPRDKHYITGRVSDAELEIEERKRKTMETKTRRAEESHAPTCGNRPYGRAYDYTNKEWAVGVNVRDERGKWTVDREAGQEKKRNIEEAARIYLNESVSWTELGKRLPLPMSAGNIHRILTKDSGSVWHQFGNPVPIPRLLDEEIIKAIRAKSEDRRTWDHGTPKHKYIFNRLIRDANPPHYALSGSSKYGVRYYKTYKGQEIRYQLNADDLEKDILNELATTLSSSTAFRKAVREVGTAEEAHRIELEQEKSSLEKRQKRVDRQISNLVMAVETSPNARAFIEKVQGKIKALDEEADKVRGEIEVVNTELGNLASVVDIEEARQRLKQMVRARPPICSMDFEEQRELVKLIYGGKDHRGRKYGIYVKCLGGKPRRFEWAAYGRVGELSGELGIEAAGIVKKSERKGKIKLRMKGQLAPSGIYPL